MSHHADRDEGGTSARPTVLFVCVANVCRSPAMQFMMRDHLARLGMGGSWTLASAGTAARDGDRMCTRAAHALHRMPGGAEFVAGHRSRLLDADQVAQADLVLVATHLERPTVSRLSAQARSRTFTMVEAALLAEAALRRPRVAWPESDPLGGLLANMRAARGSISLPERPSLGQRLLRSAHTPEGLDVRDVHSGTGATHRQTLADLRWASAHLARAIAGVEQRQPRPAP